MWYLLNVCQRDCIFILGVGGYFGQERKCAGVSLSRRQTGHRVVWNVTNFSPFRGKRFVLNFVSHVCMCSGIFCVNCDFCSQSTSLCVLCVHWNFVLRKFIRLSVVAALCMADRSHLCMGQLLM